MPIMTTTRIRFIIIFTLFVILPAKAQSDLESWHEIDLNFDVGSKVDMYWNNELRLDNNSTEIKKYQTEAGLEYKLLKRVTATGGYRYARFYDKGYYRNEHRGIVLCKYAPRIQRFVFELQTRTEYIAQATNGYISDEVLVWRNKLTINYKWPTQPLTLYTSYELFSQLAPQTYADKFRFILGGKYQLNKKMSIATFWGLQQQLDKKTDITYIVGWKVSYNLYKASKRKSDYYNE
ncbi:MAG: DUF2490 domain-containing protein [Bacteroidales bacterium]